MIFYVNFIIKNEIGISVKNENKTINYKLTSFYVSQKIKKIHESYNIKPFIRNYIVISNEIINNLPESVVYNDKNQKNIVNLESFFQAAHPEMPLLFHSSHFTIPPPCPAGPQKPA